MKNSNGNQSEANHSREARGKIYNHGDKLYVNLNSTLVLEFSVWGTDLKIGAPNQVMEKRNLLIGIANNMDSETLAIFCGSAKRYVTSAAIVIYINGPNIPSRHMEIARKMGVTLLEYRPDSIKPDFLRTFHPSSIRWVFDYALLGRNDGAFYGKFERIAMVDIRDTVFQSDPFNFLKSKYNLNSNTLHVFAEELRMTIGQCGWNSEWIKTCFGDEVLAKVSYSNIICSGVTIGTSHSTANYVNVMGRILLGETHDLAHNGAISKSKFPLCERNGVDQGIHNVIIHLGLIDHVKINYEADFPLVHLQSTVTATLGSPEKYQHERRQEHIEGKHKKERLVMAGISGITSSIVHQYDRHYQFQKYIYGQYVYWNNVTSDVDLWKKETSCNNYSLVVGKDVFMGICDIKSSRVISIDGCCRQCNQMKHTNAGCIGFAFSEGVCYYKSCQESDKPIAMENIVNYRTFLRLNAMVASNSSVVKLLDESKRVTLGNVDKDGKYIKHLQLDWKTKRYKGFVQSIEDTLDVNIYIGFDSKSDSLFSSFNTFAGHV